MVVSDYDLVRRLWLNTEGMSIKDADSRDSIAHYLARNSGLSFVAECQHDIAGAILVGTDGRRGYVQHLAVSPYYRKQTLGRRLLEHAIEALAKMGISKTHLFVLNENANAQQFYEHMDWFPRDEVRMYSFNSSSNDNV
ncbi:MAG: GNAT family N-acetyltransferase [Vibrio sp.]